MSRPRLELALEKLEPANWKRFEEFASAFLVTDYPNLRTVATPSGDQGRDAELFSSDETQTVLQYSVTHQWASKIRTTATTVHKNFPDAKVLVYVTNQQIGAAADAIKREIKSKHKLLVDIHDRTFFMDRLEGDDHREAVADQLAKDIVDPFLEGRGVIERKAQALTTLEARAALLYLALQWEDDTREKGLTSLAFDALVRSVLRSTHSDSRMPRTEIHKQVCEILDGHEPAFVSKQTDLALGRLSKRLIRHWVKEDQFCLTYDERVRLNDRLAIVENSDIRLNADIASVINAILPADKVLPDAAIDYVASLSRKVIETFLLSRGELFVSALSTGQLHQLGLEQIRHMVLSEAQKSPTKLVDPKLIPTLIESVVGRILLKPSEAVENYLRDLSDAYTLLAFLKQTPDVQGAVKKMFSEGEIWLDTSILLPVFAEELVPVEKSKFRRMLTIARDSGLKLRVTKGVIEEVERHMNRALICSRWQSAGWKGRIPFLLAFYIECGLAQSTFGGWLETFRGENRPEDDIAEYLHQFIGIEVGDLDNDIARMPTDFRIAVKEVWTQIQGARRQKSGSDIDPHLILRLAEHDTQNYVGVLGRRSQEKLSPFGYTCWWLTIDHLAFDIRNQVAGRLGQPPLPSPVMSADFLLNYLSFGPIRGRVAKHSLGTLPLALDPSLIEYLTPELLHVASDARNKSEGLPEHVIRRKVRDALDEARRRIGYVTTQGLKVLSEALIEEIE